MSDNWNSQIATLPGAHILQTAQWGEVKAAYGWKILPQVWYDDNGKLRAAAQVLQRTLSFGKLSTPLSVLYISRGPLLDWSNATWRKRILDDLQTLARQKQAIFIKFDPEVLLGYGVPGSNEAQEDENGKQITAELKARGWIFSSDQIQFQNTVWLDLTANEEDWLARMKQKARYNLRLSERKGVTVRTGTFEDLHNLYVMYAETSIRDGFVIRAEEYYTKIWRKFMEQDMAEPLIAEVEGEAIAGIFLFHFAGRAWYLYGMSRQAHREKMPNYLIQWEAMRRARDLGCTTYDLWGAPTVFNESDSMWGVFRFKEGIGGKVIRTIGAWDYPTNNSLYALYTHILPRVLDIMRRRGRSQTQQDISL